MDYKKSVYNGILMTTAILGITPLIGGIKKDMAPTLTAKSAVSLATVTILSQLGIDYAKDKGWLSPIV